jgi:transposase
MEKVGIVGLDIAKNSFHGHGCAKDGSKVFGKALPRGRVLEFFGRVEPCTIALEACAGAHHWSRELSRLGHEVMVDRPAIRETLCETAEERRSRRCSHS